MEKNRYSNDSQHNPIRQESPVMSRRQQLQAHLQRVRAAPEASIPSEHRELPSISGHVGIVTSLELKQQHDCYILQDINNYDRVRTRITGSEQLQHYALQRLQRAICCDYYAIITDGLRESNAEFHCTSVLVF